MSSAGLGLLAAALLRLTSAQATSYDASVRVEARARSNDAGAAGELEANPHLTLNVLGSAYDASLAYEPQLVARGEGDTLTVLHRVAMNAAWRGVPRWTFDGAASGSYGTMTVSQLAASGAAVDGGAGAVETLPAKSTIRHGSASLSVGATDQLTATTNVRSTVAGALEGGVDAEAQRSVPLHRSVSYSLSLDWSPRAGDVLASGLTGSLHTFSNGPLATIVLATETWKHTFNRLLHGWVATGPGFYTVHQHGSTDYRASGSGEAGLRWALLYPAIEGSLSLRGAPVTDRVTAAVYVRADVAGSMTWRPTTGWAVRGTLTGGRVMTGLQEGQIVGTAEGAVLLFDRDVWELAVGARDTWQHAVALPFGPAQLAPYNEWAGFVAFTFRNRSRL